MALNSTYGYDFYILYKNVRFVLPITPESFKITNDSNNEVINLINLGDVNIPKSPPLTEYSFTARFPMRPYPYARLEHSFKWYFDFFKTMKEEKGVFRLIVYRKSSSNSSNSSDTTNTTDSNSSNNSNNSNGSSTTNTNNSGYDDYWDTNVLVTLEEMEVNESYENGDDVLIDFKLKQYKDFGMVSVKNTIPNREETKYNLAPQKYVIKRGDTLQKIAETYGLKSMDIYKDNKDVLDQAVLDDPWCQSQGYKDCMGGSLLIEGTEITLNGFKISGATLDKLVHSSVTLNQKMEGILNADTAEYNPDNATLTFHRIKAGDTLTGIAIAYYNDASKWELIYEANKTIILNKDSLKALAGETIKIPRD